MSEKRNLMWKIWVHAKSMKMAIALIVLVTTAVTADILLLMQRWNPAEGSKTGEVYSYWWFQVLAIFLLVNLSACTIDGAVKRFKARSRNIGLWGSTIFHAGLVVILVGTLVSGNFRMFSSIKLIQGESKQIPYAALTTEETTIQEDENLFTLTLQEQSTNFDNAGKTKNIFSSIELSDQNTTSVYRMADRQELFYRGIYMFPGNYGYTVQLSINPPGDQAPPNLSVPMNTVQFSEEIKAYSLQGYTNKALPFPVSFNFYPDLGEQQLGGLINRSDRLGHPGLDINIAGSDGQTVQKLVRPGESIYVRGYLIEFTGVKPWTQLTAVYDPGATVVFGGIVVAMVGLTVFSVFDDRKRSRADLNNNNNSKRGTIND